jgi:hypothetical protein
MMNVSKRIGNILCHTKEDFGLCCLPLPCFGYVIESMPVEIALHGVISQKKILFAL